MDFFNFSIIHPNSDQKLAKLGFLAKKNLLVGIETLLF